MAAVIPPPGFQPRSDAPLLKARSLVHLRHRRRNLEETLRFYRDFGLELAARSGGALYLRAAGGGPICLILEPGPHDELVGIAVEAGSEQDLRHLAATVGGVVEERQEPGGGLVLRLRDPADLEVEVVHGVEAAPVRHPPPPVPVNSFDRPLRINAPRPAVLGPAWVRRLGHVVLGRQEFGRNARWYMETLGLVATDVEVLVELGEPIVAFLRFDRAELPVDHHSIVVAAAPEDGYLHAAFESTDVDALGAGAEWLQHRGWVKSWGIGRHVLGSQLFCYHIDPHGFEVEHYADGDMFDASYPTGYHEAGLPGLYLWGPVLPPHFVDTRMTPGRLARVIRGLRRRPEFNLRRLLATRRLYSEPPRPWARQHFVRPRPG
ncbi:MAG TPA: VOC family protein [Myxococcaceae bacterium]|nr:VOC family protein [Myxococcaceae bacterium]